MANNPGEATKRREVLKLAVETSADDPAYFCRFFLPHWFPSEMPPFHLGMLALLSGKVGWLDNYPEVHPFLLQHFKYAADPNDHENQHELPIFYYNEDGQICMVAGDHNNWIIPRGFSKTTICNANHLHELVTDPTLFAVYISKSAEHAELQLQNIKFELETNVLLREAYGDQVPNRSDPETWGADMIQLLNGAILVAKGKGGQVRGLNFRARRPNRIVLDDVEDDGTAGSPTERTKTKNWFYSAVEKAGVMMDGAEGEEWAQQRLRITNLGTLLGAQCLMMTLSADPKFNTVRFGAKLSDGSMLWPYKMSERTYDAERERHRKVGQLAEFTRELDSAIRISDDSIFPSVFIYQPTSISSLVHRAQALDPAISDKPDADHAALVVTGRRMEDGALWVLDEWGGQGKTPREKVDALFEYHLKWQTTHNGIESVAYQKALIFLLREEMARRQLFFSITPILQGSADNKVKRIEGILSPRYTNGYIRHLRPFAGLEGNLADWPNGKKDYADAAAMSFSLLGESSGLVLPDGDLKAQYEQPLPPLPPVYQTANNMILRSGRGQLGRLADRYRIGE